MAYDRKKHDAFILGKEAKKLLFLYFFICLNNQF